MFQRIIWCCLLVLNSYFTNAQITDTSSIDTTLTEAVRLIADPRLETLLSYREELKTASSYNNSGRITVRKGVRILIYSGTDRAKAIATKIDFMRKFPGTRVYLSYAMPQFRVKVGDYASRQEANDFYRQLCHSYSPCMMIPDIVEINTFRRND